MKGKYKAALALLLLLILVPLTLLMTLGLWVPTLAGIWLPVGYPYRSGTKSTPDTSWVSDSRSSLSGQ